MKRGFLILAFAMFSVTAMAQVAINTDNSLPDNSAMLDVKSTTKGLLIPRMSLSGRNAIVSPAAGLTIFQTDNIPGIYYNSGTPATPLWVMAGSGTGWSTTGNGATNPTINFIGTTDDNDLIFKRNTAWAGQIGSSNTCFGSDSYNPASTGGFNVAYGSSALGKNTTGSGNVATGYRALSSNTTGSNNTASAKEALSSNLTGSYNTANGNAALFSNTSGNGNTASGYGALYSNTTASYNTAFGFYALTTNIGDGNTAIGYFGFNSSTIGSNNVAVGYSALS